MYHRLNIGLIQHKDPLRQKECQVLGIKLYFAKTFSKYQRKRKLSHSPPLRSPEPSAKKSRDAGNTPSPKQNGLSNGNSRVQNGSPTGSQNMQTEVVQRTPSSRRRNANRDKTPDPAPPVRTRSSARLRSSKK